MPNPTVDQLAFVSQRVDPFEIGDVWKCRSGWTQLHSRGSQQTRVPHRRSRNAISAATRKIMWSRFRNPTALIVDEDVGLIFWLGDIFGKAGWNLVPALNCRQAVSLAVIWDSYIDLIVVNPALRGISKMVETLSSVHRPMVVIFRGPQIDADIPVDATIDRPDVGTSFSPTEWAERVRKLLKELIQ